jgi:TPR repeat protein
LAAKGGDPQAQYHLSREVMMRDVEAGVALLNAAADGGFAEAQYHAARRVRGGKSTVESMHRAIGWLEAATAQGHHGAMYELGMVYLLGIKNIGLERDASRARELLTQALNGGGEVVYSYSDPNGRGWIVTAQQVQRVLEQVPE